MLESEGIKDLLVRQILTRLKGINEYDSWACKGSQLENVPSHPIRHQMAIQVYKKSQLKIILKTVVFTWFRIQLLSESNLSLHYQFLNYSR